MSDMMSKGELFNKLATVQTLGEAYGIIQGMETVDAVPVVYGRWIKMGHIEHTWLVSKCSVCGNQTIDAGTYCTNCGAKMDGKNGKEVDKDDTCDKKG